MRFLLIALMALSIAACETPQDTAQNQPVNPNDQMVNETDYSVCNVNPAPHTIEGTWYIEQSQGSLRFITTYQIANGQYRLTNDCMMGNITLRATAVTGAIYDGFTFQPTREVRNEQKIENPNFKMTCEAAITTQKISYGFRGNCLVFNRGSNDGGQLVLAPR